MWMASRDSLANRFTRHVLEPGFGLVRPAALLLLISALYFGTATISAQQQLTAVDAVSQVAPLVASSKYVRASMELGGGAGELVWINNTEANYRAAHCSSPGPGYGIVCTFMVSFAAPAGPGATTKHGR